MYGRASGRLCALSEPTVNHRMGDPPARDHSHCGAPRGKEQGLAGSRATGGMGGDRDGAFRFPTAEMTANCKQMMDARKQYLSQNSPAIVYNLG